MTIANYFALTFPVLVFVEDGVPGIRLLWRIQVAGLADERSVLPIFTTYEAIALFAGGLDDEQVSAIVVPDTATLMKMIADTGGIKYVIVNNRSEDELLFGPEAFMEMIQPAPQPVIIGA